MFDFSKDSDIFDVEEKIVLNHLAEGVDKDNCCEQLSFGMEISEDEDCVSILQAVYAKIRDLSVEEWEDLQKYLPFDVPISDDDFLLDELDSLTVE